MNSVKQKLLWIGWLVDSTYKEMKRWWKLNFASKQSVWWLQKTFKCSLMPALALWKLFHIVKLHLNTWNLWPHSIRLPHLRLLTTASSEKQYREPNSITSGNLIQLSWHLFSTWEFLMRGKVKQWWFRGMFRIHAAKIWSISQTLLLCAHN